MTETTFSKLQTTRTTQVTQPLYENNSLTCSIFFIIPGLVTVFQTDKFLSVSFKQVEGVFVDEENILRLRLKTIAPEYRKVLTKGELTA